MLQIKRIVSLVVFGAALGVHAYAGTITLGQNPDSSNVFPFGVPEGLTSIGTYQQVYNSNAFSTIGLITDITFYKSIFPIAGGGFNGQNYAFYLSTTSKSVNGLDLSSSAANLGADNSLFVSLTGLTGAVGNSITFSGTGFQYDPSKGNLLLTIVVTGSVSDRSAFLPLDSHNGSATGDISRAMFDKNGNTYCCGTDNFGLTTTFTTATATPEPSSAILLGLGLGVVAMVKRRRS